jgi:predicted nucleotidyltransferase
MDGPLPLDDLRAELERRIGLDALWVFGSVARGTDTDGSDLDLAALFARRPSAEELIALRTDLAAQAGRDVDLVDLDTASPIVAMQVLRHGRLLVDRAPRRRVAFASGLPGRYEDIVRLRRPAEQALLRRVARGGA